MRSRAENAGLFAKMFPQRLFARIHKKDRGGKHQHGKLHQQQGGQVFLGRLEKPGFRNLEAELVIQRLGGSGEQAFWLRKNAHHAAFIERAGDFAFDARAVNFQQQREEVFHGHQAQ